MTQRIFKIHYLVLECYDKKMHMQIDMESSNVRLSFRRDDDDNVIHCVIRRWRLREWNLPTQTAAAAVPAAAARAVAAVPEASATAAAVADKTGDNDWTVNGYCCWLFRSRQASCRRTEGQHHGGVGTSAAQEPHPTRGRLQVSHLIQRGRLHSAPTALRQNR